MTVPLSWSAKGNHLDGVQLSIIGRPSGLMPQKQDVSMPRLLSSNLGSAPLNRRITHVAVTSATHSNYGPLGREPRVIPAIQSSLVRRLRLHSVRIIITVRSAAVTAAAASFSKIWQRVDHAERSLLKTAMFLAHRNHGSQ